MTIHADLSRDQLAVARSAFIDAFAGVEDDLCALLRKLNIEPDVMFTRRVLALRGVKASPQFSKKARDAVHQVLNRLEKINAVRCDVVHGRLQPVRVDGAQHACFINPLNRDALGATARLISSSQLEAVTTELGKIAQVLRKPEPSPASSPPRPSPGAAGDP